MSRAEKDMKRFWSFVDAPAAEACWEWRGGKVGNGYGSFSVQNKTVRAHRFIWQACTGETSTMFVCHKCDNPGYVNPSHLFEGTAKDNAKDAVRKGRTAIGARNGSRIHPERLATGNRNGSRLYPERLSRGENRWAAKLSACDVLEIRERYRQGVPVAEMLPDYPVNRSKVYDAIAYRTWKHLP